MRLAAIYIPAGALPFIFDQSHQGQIVNLGGEFTYNILEDNDNITLLSRSINRTYISNFWGSRIELISAIVGRNGIGKTSILRGMNHPVDPGHISLVYIFETDDQTLIHVNNETHKPFINESGLYIDPMEQRGFEALYYSPNLDYELKSAHSPIALVNYIDDSLETYYLDTIARNVLLLNNPIIKDIKSVYPDFPAYEKYVVKIKQFSKSHFTRVYADANFANANTGDALRNELEGDIMRLQDQQREVNMSNKDLIKLFKGQLNSLERESFSALFRKIWNLDDYKTINDLDKIHDGKDILKDFEVTILSCFLLGAVFPQTGLGGRIQFSEILDAADFLSRLDKFLELYLISEYEMLYEKIKADLQGIKVDDAAKIVNIISRDTWSKLEGVDVENVRARMIADINKFKNAKEFYTFLNLLIERRGQTEITGSIKFSIGTDDVLEFTELITRYKELLNQFKDLPISIAILELFPNNKLSTGEKAIIDFFASLHDYIERTKDQKHQNYQSYLLLLDEPELGYHPIWKKKFVSAIVKVLPILFSEIKPQFYDSRKKEYVAGISKFPSLQIVFSTHDPLTLSDVPRSNIIYLNKTGGGYSEISHERFRSFAANVTDLLADSFFIEDGLLGDFARNKINETITWLNSNEDFSHSEMHKKVIELIDEPIIQSKLAEMYSEKMKDTLAKDILKREIDNLTDRYNKM